MSGQELFNKVLVEKEKALGRKESFNAYMGLAASFMMGAYGYSTLTYLAAQPALCASPEKAGSTHTSPASIAALNEPESGVKLLLAIFSRLGGSGSLVAMAQEGGNRWAYRPNVWGAKAKSRRTEQTSPANQTSQQAAGRPESQFNQGLSLNAADPALSIRPQVNKRAALDEYPNSSLQTASQQLQAAPAARGLAQTGWYKAPMTIKIVSDSPAIREFTPASKVETAADNKKSPARRQVNLIEEPLGRARIEHQNLVEQAKDLPPGAGAGADSVTGIIRPSEQPGLFKYVREYYKDSLKNMPAPTALPGAAPLSIPQILDGAPLVADSRISGEPELSAKSGSVGGYGGGSNYAGGGSKSISASFDADKEANSGFNISNFRPIKRKPGSLGQLAFLPPNSVHGINGLSLGSSTAETIAFLKSNGKFSKVVLEGFQIFTLKGERGATLLQAFVRDERLEALRVFTTTYVPQQLGVTLGEDLASMKAKFGEPAFILEEPRLKAKAPPVMAKNYVYPVSQVSFQLSRPNAGASPQVLSMLLFRFL